MFSIIVSKGYSETSFKEDLKKLFLMVGVDNKSAVFFLTQSQVSDESIYTLTHLKCLFITITIMNENAYIILCTIRFKDFLEIINNILMIGMIPALFTEEERDFITNGVKKYSIPAGYENTK